MNKILSQTGAFNLETTSNDLSELIYKIKRALNEHGASDVMTDENKIIFKGGTLFKFEFNPLLPISEGEIQVFNDNGTFKVRYVINLMRLIKLYLILLCVFLLFFVVGGNASLAENLITFGAMSGVAFVLLVLGYFGAASARFTKLIKRAVK